MNLTKTLRLLSLYAALIAIPAFAQTYTWTGAVNNRYDNPANWTVGGQTATTVPGRYLDGGTETGDYNDTIEFGPLVGVDAATIDFENAVSVSNFVIKAGAPAYTFGTSSAQTFQIITDSTGYKQNTIYARLTVDSGVTTTQTFALALTFGAQDYYSNASNDGSAELVFAAGLGTPYNSKLTFGGHGNIRIKNYTGTAYQCTLFNDGKIIIEDSTGSFKSFGPSKSAGMANMHEIEIVGANKFFTLSDSSKGTYGLSCYASCRIFGEGTFKVNNMTSDAAANGSMLLFMGAAADTLTIDSRLTFAYSQSKYKDTFPHTVYLYGGGTIVLNNTCTGTHGDLVIGLNSDPTKHPEYVNTKVVVPYIGGASDALSHLGDHVTNVIFTANGSFGYSGAGETTAMPLKGIGGVDQVMTLKNQGTGLLTYAGAIRSVNSSAKLRLNADTAPIAFAGTCDCADGLTLCIAGANTVTVASPDVADAYVLEGGTFAFETAGTYTTPMTAASGNSTVAIPDGTTLTVSGFTVASGATVNFTMDIEQSHVFLPGFAAADVSKLRINGYSGVALTAEGELVLNISRWAAAVDGKWSESAKWIGGVPTANKPTWVRAKGAADYTVTVDETPAAISQLEIGRDTASPKATVDIKVPVPLATADAVKIAKGGELRVSAGGQLALGNATAVNLNGGLFDVRKDGSITWSGSLSFGSGETVFHDGAAMTNAVRGTIAIGADRAGETARVTFSGLYVNEIKNSYIAVGSPACDGARAVLNFNNDSDYIERYVGGYTNTYFTDNKPIYITVGFRRGYGEMNVSGGSVVLGNMALYVASEVQGGSPKDPSSDVNSATGVVNVTRGALYVGGYAAEYDTMLCGLVIGHGAVLKTTALRDQTHYWGELNLSGNGLVGTARGAMIVGAGSADGIVRQSGGRLEMSLALAVAPVVVGFEGGVGLYDFTGGKIDSRDIYVGGATIEQLKHCDKTGKIVLDATVLQPDRHDAQGTLKLAGGKAKVTAGIHVGVDGTGLVEFSGTNTTTCALLNLTNENATLAFKLGSDGKVGWSATATSLYVGEGAKLKIDLSDCSAQPYGWRKLASVGTMTGSFDAEDIEIRMPGKTEYKPGGQYVVFDRNGTKGIWLRIRKGLMVVFR